MNRLFFRCFLPGLFSVLVFASCGKKEAVGLIVHNGIIYTLDSAFSQVQAFAVKDGKIVGTGSSEEMLSRFSAKEKFDCKGAVVYPGFIDAHCHFLKYAIGLERLDLVGCKSFKEVLDRLVSYVPGSTEEWIQGRGWDQNLWENKSFPVKNALDSLFPDRPVVLTRIDGHVALVNSKALALAGINEKTRISGGEIFLEKGKPTGILVDNAVDLVTSKIPQPGYETWKKVLSRAQENCFAAGLTGLAEAGLMRDEIELIEKLQSESILKIRIYAMIADSAPNFEYYLNRGPYQTERLNVRSFKFYGDGALGSRGACLIKPYNDRPGHYGFLLRSKAYYDEMGHKLAAAGFQMNTHCIGDSAVRLMTDLYGHILGKNNDARWRIEHCQVVHPEDLKNFREFGIIPSIQPTHATSDMEWVPARLGNERALTSYAYKELLGAAGRVALGTDFPVERIYPLETFYAAVFRKTTGGNPPGGFQPGNALSREEALKGITIWAAYANFEEKVKGSLEQGKWADFVVLDKDLMSAGEEEILKARILYTYLNGELVYGQ
jgi:predicted amidohydrolase YtcJ